MLRPALSRGGPRPAARAGSSRICAPERARGEETTAPMHRFRASTHSRRLARESQAPGRRIRRRAVVRRGLHPALPTPLHGSDAPHPHPHSWGPTSIFRVGPFATGRSDSAYRRSQRDRKNQFIADHLRAQSSRIGGNTLAGATDWPPKNRLLQKPCVYWAHPWH